MGCCVCIVTRASVQMGVLVVGKRRECINTNEAVRPSHNPASPAGGKSDVAPRLFLTNTHNGTKSGGSWPFKKTMAQLEDAATPLEAEKTNWYV